MVSARTAGHGTECKGIDLERQRAADAENDQTRGFTFPTSWEAAIDCLDP